MVKFNRSRQRVVLIFALAALWAPAALAQPKAKPGLPNSFVKTYKMDDVVAARSRGNPLYRSTIIVTLADGAELPAQFRLFARGGKLGIINSVVLEDLPNGLLSQLARNPAIASLHDNRDAVVHNYRTGLTVGARAVQETMGLTGRGIGVAVIDSGVSSFHDDLTRGASLGLFPYGDQRVLKFVDFVGGRTLPYDDNGHGTHVAGTIAGNGYDSRGEKSGMAPEASLVVLKVLDANGMGTIGNIIAALNWVAQNAGTYNIRVVNMSVGASVRESYWTDPLTLAVRAVTNKGIVVVVAAGNLGKNANGHSQYGGIMAPGNAPWSLTVGASSTEGTANRKDDIMAGFSSRGPTFLDWNAKPDLVAPGTGTVSLAVPGSLFYSTKSQYLLKGSISTATKPYLALSGTSMSAPVVSGTVALMMQANPRLTPNLVKAILQYTAQTYPGYDRLTEGAGFLNTLGAVKLAKFYAVARAGDRVPVQKVWSRHIFWGNHVLTGGIMVPSANAWGANIVWGTAKTLGSDGDNIVWGTWGDGDNIVWGTSDGDNIVWGTWGDGDNIVWGTVCGGADCNATVWGTWGDGDNIVWGTWGDGDNIVWGTSGNEIDATVFPADDASEPPPSVLDQFGDTVGGL